VCVSGVVCLWRHRRVHGFGVSTLAPLVVFGLSATTLTLLAERCPLPALLAIGAIVPLALAIPLRAWPFELRIADEDLA
jgi:hypothetical protein